MTNKIIIITGLMILVFIAGFYSGLSTLDPLYVLENHQTLIAAIFTTLVGGGGIILQLRHNEKNRTDQLKEKEDKRRQEIEENDRKAKEKIKIMASSLLPEVKDPTLRAQLILKLTDENWPTTGPLCLDFHDKIYQMFLSKIGHFNVETVSAIHSFYALKKHIIALNKNIMKEEIIDRATHFEHSEKLLKALVIDGKTALVALSKELENPSLAKLETSGSPYFVKGEQ